ncbi:MAG: biopolymer transporter ExbD [Polyangiaceae bacterium]|nr:biopolymer transporter ExbD [Polyangiaceae bacterium]
MAGGASSDDDGMISGINVTPLVDVVLVLLIIFMVTARIIHAQGMPMDLPKASSGKSLKTVFSVELGADGTTMVDSEKVAGDAQIRSLAQAAITETPELRAVIRADSKVEHGRVIHVLDVLKKAKISKIAFAVSPGTDTPQEDSTPSEASSPAKAAP